MKTALLNTDYISLEDRAKRFYCDYFDDNKVTSITIDVDNHQWSGSLVLLCLGASYTRQVVALYLVSHWYGAGANFVKVAESCRGNAYNISLTMTKNTITIDTGEIDFGYYALSIL